MFRYNYSYGRSQFYQTILFNDKMHDIYYCYYAQMKIPPKTKSENYSSAVLLWELYDICWPKSWFEDGFSSVLSIKCIRGTKICGFNFFFFDSVWSIITGILSTRKLNYWDKTHEKHRIFIESMDLIEISRYPRGLHPHIGEW